MRNFWMTAVLVGGLLSSCNSQNAVTVNGQKMELEDGVYAHFATTEGDVLITLETAKAPLTSANFAALAEGTHPGVSEEYKGKPFYDGLVFHRVIPSFMIQGGDPLGSGAGGPGYKFDNEIGEGLSHIKGAVSMANSGPNTNGSQFFITVAETKHLDGSYNIFGKVVAGQEVADAISSVSRNPQDRPDTDVMMTKVSIIRQGKDFKDYNPAETFGSAQEDKVAAMKLKKEEEAKKMAEYTEGAIKTSTGMFYKVITEGTGPKPEENQMVSLNYAGYLPDGSLFDTSIEEVAKKEGKFDARRPYKPLEIEASRNAQVILGWREAVTMMNVGDKWQLIIPPHLAYGERGYPPVIPANSWLIFDIEMIEIVK
ncbi:MAG: peptidylprolyl isomerase [Roseivirga sp.]|jgi:peptidylprolyl isomerase